MNNLKKIVFSVSLLTLLTFFMNGLDYGELSDWTWSDFNLAFQVPSKFKIVKSTDTYFQASSSDNKFTMELTPYKDSSVTAKDVAYVCYNKTPSWTNKEIEQEAEVESEFPDFKGYIIVGIAFKNNKKLNYAMVGLIDPNSDVNLYAVFSWWDDPNNNDNFISIAEEIAKSFKKME